MFVEDLNKVVDSVHHRSYTVEVRQQEQGEEVGKEDLEHDRLLHVAHRIGEC